jgi:hypothetical protein
MLRAFRQGRMVMHAWSDTGNTPGSLGSGDASRGGRRCIPFMIQP